MYLRAALPADLHSLVDPAIKTALISEKLPAVLPYLPAPRGDLPVLCSANFSFSSLHAPGFTGKTPSSCLGLLVPSAASIPVPLEVLV